MHASPVSGVVQSVASVHGNVSIEGGGWPAKKSVIVEIVPRGRGKPAKPKYNGYNEANGNYQIENIAPGTYNLIAHDELTYNYVTKPNIVFKEGDSLGIDFILKTRKPQGALRGKLSSDSVSYVELVVNTAGCDGCVLKRVNLKSGEEFQTELVAFQDYLLTFESEKIPESKKPEPIQMSLGSLPYRLDLTAENGSLVAKLVEIQPINRDTVEIVAQTSLEPTQTVLQTELRPLPLRSPNLLFLLSLSPQSSTRPGVSGASNLENRFVLDKTGDSSNQIAYSVQPVASTSGNELQLVQSGYSSQRGISISGDPKNIVTRGGSTEVHGRVDYWFRNEALDARNFFSLADFDLFRKQTLGFQLGGPLIKNRCFFSLGYDFTRSKTAPTFSPVLTSQILQLNQQLARLGLPPENLRRLLTSSAMDVPLVRIDYKINNTDSLLLRYSFTDDLTHNEFSTSPGNTSAAPSSARTVFDRNHFFTVQYPGESSSKHFAVSYRYRHDEISFTPVEPLELSLLIPGVVLAGRTPNLATGDYEQQSNHLFSATLTRTIRSKHTISLGTQFGLDSTLFRFASFDFGRAVAPTIAALSTSIPTIDLFEIGQMGQQVSFDASVLNFYFQDVYKPKSNLTFNLGIRNKVEFPPSFQDKEVNGLQPSASFAWDIQNRGKTVLRAGYSIYRERRPQLPIAFELLMGGQGLQQHVPQPVRRVMSFVGNAAAGPAVLQFLAGSLPSGPQLAITYEPSSRSPVLHTFTVTLEQKLTARLDVQLSYLSEHSNRLLTTTNVNLLPPILIKGREDFRGLVLNPAFAQIYQYQTVGSASYSGASISAQLKRLKGVSLSGAYTLSRMVDDTVPGNFEATPENAFDRRKDRTLSDFHATHRLSVFGRWDLPIHTNLSKTPGKKTNPFARLLGQPFVEGKSDLKSGRYFNVITGFDANHDGNPLTDRPVNVGRNTFLGPRFAQIDLRMGSLIRVSESKKFEWAVDFFNLLNRTNFAGVNTVLGSPDLVGLDPRIISGRKGISDFDYRQPLAPNGFGLATSAFSPRRIQIGLKFSF